MNIGERIISLRKMANISQKELAKLLGMSTTSMNRIELGTRPLRDDEISKISDVFDISADFLLGRASSRKEGGTEYSKEMRNFLAIARESKPRHIEIATNLLSLLKEEKGIKKEPSKKDGHKRKKVD